VRTFPATGVKKVVVRAAAADTAIVTVDPKLDVVEISGQPAGGARGYHPSDPNWKETPPGDWGLDFVSARYGSVLVISTRSEIHYIHHRYAFNNVKIRVLSGVEVVRERRELTGDGEGKPNLAKPD
jgi:hypothetical protein